MGISESVSSDTQPLTEKDNEGIIKNKGVNENGITEGASSDKRGSKHGETPAGARGKNLDEVLFEKNFNGKGRVAINQGGHIRYRIGALEELIKEQWS